MIQVSSSKLSERSSCLNRQKTTRPAQSRSTYFAKLVVFTMPRYLPLDLHDFCFPLPLTRPRRLGGILNVV